MPVIRKRRSFDDCATELLTCFLDKEDRSPAAWVDRARMDQIGVDPQVWYQEALVLQVYWSMVAISQALGTDRDALKLVDALAVETHRRCFKDATPDEFRAEFVPRARNYYEALRMARGWPSTLHATFVALGRMTGAPLAEVRQSRFADSFRELMPMLLVKVESYRDGVRFFEERSSDAARRKSFVAEAFVQQPAFPGITSAEQAA